MNALTAGMIVGLVAFVLIALLFGVLASWATNENDPTDTMWP